MSKEDMIIVELYRSDNKQHYKTLKFSEDDFMDFINLVELISKIFKKKGLFKMIKKGGNAQSRLQKLIDLAYKTRKVKIKILVDVDEEGDEH
jgi:fumarate reductase subunit C